MAPLLWTGALVAGYTDSGQDNSTTLAKYNEYVGFSGGLAPAILHQGFNIQRADLTTNPFPTAWCDRMRNLGALPMVDMLCRQSSHPTGQIQPEWSYDAICNGNHDAHFLSWANAAAAWNKPLFLRVNHEMNGAKWFAWLQGQDYNKAINGATKSYADAWRYIHSIMAPIAPKITWYWCANTKWSAYPLNSSNWPGKAYVDYAGFDTYFGRLIYADNAETFITTQAATYDEVATVCEGLPMLIGETGAEEHTPIPNEKRDWFIGMWAAEWRTRFPLLKGVVYYHRSHANLFPGEPHKENWLANTSTQSVTGYQTLGDHPDIWISNIYANYDTTGAIPVPVNAPSPPPLIAPSAPISVTKSPRVKLRLHKKV